MQDRHVLVIEPEGFFGGVYDGHAGVRVAEAAGRHLHAFFFAALRRGLGAEAAFREAFAETDRLTAGEACGAGATAIFISGVAGGQLVAANLGDGRVVVVRDDGVEAVTRDHRIDDPGERARVVAAGAWIDPPYVMRGEAGLMLTRSLGDRWFRAVGVIATPDVFVRALGPRDRWLVVASDGLWDELDNGEVASVVRGAAGAGLAALALADAVTARGGHDNVTVLVVDLPPVR
jgi:serine/threonine protein phosphatase PrpC